MSIISTLRKEGIQVQKKLDTSEVNIISERIANILCSAFPDHQLQYDNLINCISSLNMYTATFENTLVGAKYFCHKKSIFFNADININKNDMFSLHECIHFLQDSYISKTNPKSLGLYSITKDTGLGLNEAAVQLMSSKINGIPKEFKLHKTDK